jgi:hypothetical protein
VEVADDDLLSGGGSGAEAPKIHGERKRTLGDARGVVGRGKSDGLENVGGGVNGLQAAHDGGDDAIRGPGKNGQ